MTTFIRRRNEESGRIYMRHLRMSFMCAKGTRAALANDFNLTELEIADFFKNGMQIEQFREKFGHDAMGQQVIQAYEGEVANE